MFASRFIHTTTSFVRRALPLFAVLGAVTLAACGDDGDGDGDGTGPTGVNGMWETEGLYMHVSSDEITFYIDFEECHLAVTYDVVDIDGDTYTVEIEGEPAGEITLNRTGSNLSIEADGEAYVMEPSDVDPTDLELCDDTGGGEFDPALGTCTSYPSLTLGTPVNGTLSTSDMEDASGYYFDAYRLQIGSTTTVDVSLSSDFIDSYLYLYNAGGTLIASNDDEGAGLDSFLTESLTAGCYIVVASSFDPAETGSYTLIAE